MAHIDLKRAQALMKQKGLDAVIASSHDNFYYATGYNVRSLEWSPSLAVLPANPNSTPAMIVSFFHQRQAAQQSHIRDIRSFPLWMPIVDVDELLKGTAKKAEKQGKQFKLEPVYQILADILKEKGLQDGTIGVETNLTKNPEIKALLSKQNPKVKFVEADSTFWQLRKVKTPEEINILRQAADFAVKGLQAVAEGGVTGKTIGELHLRYRQGVWAVAKPEHAMDLYNLRFAISSGDYFGTVDNAAYRVAKGDVLWADNGVTLFGYTSDMGRTFAAGKPGEPQKKLFEAIRAGYEEAVSRVKPGTRIKEIHRALQETVNKAGYEWYARGHMGHSVGVGSLEQPPFVSADEESELEPNMIMCVECGAYVTGRFGAFQIEDMFLVKPGGHEVLTPMPRDMVEI